MGREKHLFEETVGIDPVDEVAVALHAAKPGHLALGELVDGVGEEGAHLVVAEDAEDVLRHEFVFQTVIDQVFGGDAGGEQAADLVDETFGQARVEARVDPRVACLAVHERADVESPLREERRIDRRTVLVEAVAAGRGFDVEARAAA